MADDVGQLPEQHPQAHDERKHPHRQHEPHRHEHGLRGERDEAGKLDLDTRGDCVRSEARRQRHERQRSLPGKQQGAERNGYEPRCEQAGDVGPRQVLRLALALELENVVVGCASGARRNGLGHSTKIGTEARCA